MTLRVSGIITMDATDARSELAATGTEVRKLGAAGRASGPQIDSLAQAEARAARQALVLRDNHRLAAGQVGNLTAQFNDIGVMLMAGQNPLQLAIQQGTQITQVIGPMGATGAARALGSALASMLNPLSLATIGSIAAGAALTQWLTGASEKAQDFEDELTSIGDAIDVVRAKTDEAKEPLRAWVAGFGDASPAVRQVMADMVALAKIDAYRSIDAVSASVRDLVLDLSFFDDRSSQSAAQDFLGLSSISSSARDLGAQFAANLELLKNSVDPAERLRTALTLRDQLLGSVGGSLEKLSENEQRRQFFDGLSTIIRDLSELGALEQPGPSAQQMRAWQTFYNMRVAGEEAILARQTKSREVYYRTRQINAEHERSALDLLSVLEQENVMREAITRSGQDSVTVLKLQHAAEREALEEKLASLDASEETKNEIRAALEAGQKFALLNMSGGLAAAAAEATRLADQVTRAYEGAVALSRQGQLSVEDAEIRLKYAEDPVEQSRHLAMARMRRQQQPIAQTIPSGMRDQAQSYLDNQVREYGDLIAREAELDQKRLAQLKASRASAGGSRSSKEERDALADLVEQEELQLAILRETDPVQKEMLRNRESLAAATQAERLAVAELIGERMREEQATARATERAEFFRSSIFDVLTGIRRGGDEAAAAIGRVASAIEDAAWQAFLLGDGPLADVLGFGRQGGLIGQVLGAVFPALKPGLPAMAEGGYLSGKGSGTSDDILMWGSSGEFMMNARATKRWRHVLEAMNDGAIPSFARGGSIGPGFSSSRPSTPISDAPIIHIENMSGTQLSGTREDTIEPGGRRKTRLVLADAVGESLQTRGGGARRALRNQFGVTPRGTRR